MIDSLARPSFDVRCFCVALAAMLLVGSLPLTIGVVLIHGERGGPSLTLDICHPAQSSIQIAGIVMAHPAPGAVMPRFSDQGHISERPAQSALDLPIPPDTPPPKTLA